MPAKTEKQKNFMKMALAVKHGHEIKGISPATRAKLRKAAGSMSDKSLKDFAHVAKQRKR